MPRIFNFTRFSLRDLLATAAPTMLAIGLLCLLAFWLVDPAPPRQVTISTGQENSAYEEFARRYAAALARQGVRATLKPSLGSQQNLQRLNDPASGIGHRYRVCSERIDRSGRSGETGAGVAGQLVYRAGLAFLSQ
jgi:hypothetical protein